MADEKNAIDMEKKRISDGKTLLEIKQKYAYIYIYFINDLSMFFTCTLKTRRR